MPKRGPGRPKGSTRINLDDLMDDDGNPVSLSPEGKHLQAMEFKRQVEEADADRKSNRRGMYAGMADPESYLEMYKTTIGKQRKGRPWTYPTAEALQAEVTAYFEFVVDRRISVTVAGLCAWLGITTSTLRMWKNNSATMPFYEVVEPAIGFIHGMVEQGAAEGIVPVVFYIYSSKNYHGLQDKVEYEVTPSKSYSSIEQEDIIGKLPIKDE